jgi:hypothetical protein
MHLEMCLTSALMKARGYLQASATLITGKGSSVPLQLAAAEVPVPGCNPRRREGLLSLLGIRQGLFSQAIRLIVTLLSEISLLNMQHVSSLHNICCF